MKTVINLKDRLETVVNELLFHNVTINFLVDNNRKRLSINNIIPLDAKISYFRPQSHTFPVDRSENVFEKRQKRFVDSHGDNDLATMRHELEVGRKAATKLLRIGETLTDRERHHCGVNFSEILDPRDDLFGWKWKKRKNFHARISIPLPSIPRFFSLSMKNRQPSSES